MKLGDKYYALLNDDQILINFLKVVYGEEDKVLINKYKKIPIKLNRQTIMLYRRKGMPSDEIAKRMGVNKTQYFKVLRALKIPLKKTRPRLEDM